jgi:hypothetical protein
MKGAMRRNYWSTVSLFITVFDAVLIFAIIRYLYWRGLWDASQRTHVILSVWGGCSVLVSLATAIVGLIRDPSKAYGASALCLSLFSFLFYVQ